MKQEPVPMFPLLTRLFQISIHSHILPIHHPPPLMPRLPNRCPKHLSRIILHKPQLPLELPHVPLPERLILWPYRSHIELPKIPCHHDLVEQETPSLHVRIA